MKRVEEIQTEEERSLKHTDRERERERAERESVCVCLAKKIKYYKRFLFYV